MSVIPGRAKRESGSITPVTEFSIHRHREYGFRARAKRRVPE
ncbi:MAG: hypothetical protein QOD89_323 [Bradyrhizobium sp.]|nr:hypothetical protein [Bradyrhizobium sp.]